MRILKTGNKTVFVASNTGKPGCPRVSINKGTTKFADDYYGRIKMRKSLISKLFNI